MSERKTKGATDGFSFYSALNIHRITAVGLVLERLRPGSDGSEARISPSPGSVEAPAVLLEVLALGCTPTTNKGFDSYQSAST